MKFPMLHPASALFPSHFKLGLGPAPYAVAAGQDRAGGGKVAAWPRWAGRARREALERV
jgi:hypothetical protein